MTLCANMEGNVKSMWAVAIIPSSGATVSSDSQENFVKNVNAHICFFHSWNHILSNVQTHNRHFQTTALCCCKIN